jgi:hypothetical protein
MFKKLSLWQVGFLQALGIVLYCSLVGTIFWKGNEIFGPMSNLLGPVVFLSLFITSALISSLIGLGYSIILFWEKKQARRALNLVIYTTSWLAAFVLLALITLLLT